MAACALRLVCSLQQGVKQGRNSTQQRRCLLLSRQQQPQACSWGAACSISCTGDLGEGQPVALAASAAFQHGTG